MHSVRCVEVVGILLLLVPFIIVRVFFVRLENMEQTLVRPLPTCVNIVKLDSIEQVK